MLRLAPSLPPQPQLIPGLTCCLSVMQKRDPKDTTDIIQGGSCAAESALLTLIPGFETGVCQSRNLS